MTFISDEGQLQNGLFTPYQPRYGAHTSLNINFIPDLLHHIKKQLTAQQLIRLQDYHLQNYLMELSISYKQTKSLNAITGTILTHIRNNNNFWYRHNNQQQLDQEQQLKHHAIVCYHKDIQCLKQAFKDNVNSFHFQPQYQRKTSLAYQFQLLHNTCEPYFGTRQPLNHIAYIPSFLIQKFIQQKGKQLEKNQEKQPKIAIQYRNGQKTQVKNVNILLKYEKERQIMYECIIFLMSNKQRHTNLSKESKKDNSEQVQEQLQSSSSKEQNNQSISQQQTIFDQFLIYMQTISSLPKFPNSHHMQTLTLNLINSCKKVLNIFSQSANQNHEIEKNQKNHKQQETSRLKTIDLDSKIVEIISKISQKHLTQAQLDLISVEFLKNWDENLKFITRQMRKRQLSSLSKNGWLDTQEQIQKIKESYQNMLDHPQFVQLTKYRAMGTGIPWKQEDYLKFLKGLKEFLNIPTNNKKIAASMGEDYEPNHVKHIKGIYLTVMKQRMERGECGGGKRGKSLSKSDFIEKDLNNFSMKWFEKAKKIKKRKPKRKRKNSDLDDCEQQPDSEY